MNAHTLQIFFSIVILTCSCLLQAAKSDVATPEGPNIIFLLADDQRDDALACYGNPIVQSPTLDGLANAGARFENAFCQVPICAASRASLLTGLSQRTHGHNFGLGSMPAKLAKTSYPAVLKNAGYRIGFVGKYGVKFQASTLKKDFDFFKAINRKPYLKKMKDGSLRHETDLCADAAIDFIQSNSPDQPFCLSISFNATHAEDGDKRPGYHFQWPDSTDGLYEDINIPEPRLGPDYFDALPDFMRDENELGRQRYYWRWDTPEKYQTNMRAYYRMVTGIDNAISRVLDVLESKGITENTIIIYSADNGFMMGDRGLAGKWNHYEQSLRVPLIIYDPRLPETSKGRVIENLVSNLDIPATIVSMAELKIPSIYQGVSLLPLLENKSVDTWRSDIFTEHIFGRYNNWHSVRNERFKYAVYYDDPYEALYDLEKDPNEGVNLANNPEYSELLEKMKERMDAYHSMYTATKKTAPER